ncbi:transposase [Chryseobacterium soli]|uniref:Transposase n=1 Tax=Chryseobacterium soli TaxID=445961 RepID=A0A086A980_9FLAO|nr:transposase [Chryseobacterium soli]KFF13244.1 transposase [Chryseobacterium soli]
MNKKKREQPNYKSIYTDIILKKFPQKKDLGNSILKKEELSILDIIKINELISETTDKENLHFNQSHRSYNKAAIFEILEYQKKNKLNNSQLARHFKLSRTTVAKWKKLFISK